MVRGRRIFMEDGGGDEETSMSHSRIDMGHPNSSLDGRRAKCRRGGGE